MTDKAQMFGRSKRKIEVDLPRKKNERRMDLERKLKSLSEHTKLDLPFTN